jgi:hypothetical protein
MRDPAPHISPLRPHDLAILRITGGNFRLMQHLLTQIERVLQINERRTVTKEVVEATRENLVIGLT